MIFSQWVTIELSWFENKHHFMFIIQEYKNNFTTLLRVNIYFTSIRLYFIKFTAN